MSVESTQSSPFIAVMRWGTKLTTDFHLAYIKFHFHPLLVSTRLVFQSVMSLLSKVSDGRAMAQAVSHMLLTAETQFRARVSPRGI
jgi:hypothetical protein